MFRSHGTSLCFNATSKVQKLSAEQIEQILAMTEPGQLDLVLRKRLNESMRRRFESAEGPPLHSPTLNPKPETPKIPRLCGRTGTRTVGEMEGDQGSGWEAHALYATQKVHAHNASH